MIYLFFSFILALIFFRHPRSREGGRFAGGRIIIRIHVDGARWKKPLFYTPGTNGKQISGPANGKIPSCRGEIGARQMRPMIHILSTRGNCCWWKKLIKHSPYGIIHYEKRDLRGLHRELENHDRLLADMKRDEYKKDVPRSHEQAARCARCGFRNACDQSLA